MLATVEVASIAPLDRVEIVVNGVVARSLDVRGRGRRFEIREELELAGSAWVAATAVGPAARAITDGYPYAHTTPVYVVRNGEPFADPGAARRLADIVRVIAERAERGAGDSESGARFLAAVREAIDVYERIASTGRPIR